MVKDILGNLELKGEKKQYFNLPLSFMHHKQSAWKD